MKRKILFILPLILLILQCCVSGPYTSKGQMELMQNYFNSENSSDWILVKIGEWEYDCYMRGEKQICEWGRNEKWYNPDSRLISSTGTIIPSEMTTYKEIKENNYKFLYIGEWKYSDKFNNYIRAFMHQGHIEFEQMDKNNKNIKSVKFDEKIKIPAFNLAKIKWFDKYGYNAYYDRKTGTIKQAGE